jgi:membrane protease YdiL (CAAX protease family)
MDVGVAERQGTGLRALVSRHPIAVFLVLTLGSAYLLSVVPILMQYDVIPGKTLPARILRWRVGVGWWLVALVALPLLTVIGAVLLGDVAVLPSGNVLLRELVGILVAWLLINLWEEAGWAGFLQTRLERRFNFFLAALLTGIPFAAIHMPLQVITGDVRSALDFGVNLALLMVLVAFVRSLFGMVMRGAANSLLLVGLTHAMFNRSNNIDGIAADILPGGDSRQLAAFVATVVLVAVLGLVLRRKLSRPYRRELDEAEHRA